MADTRSAVEARLQRKLERFLAEQRERVLVVANWPQEDMDLYNLMFNELVGVATAEAQKIIAQLTAKLDLDPWSLIWSYLANALFQDVRNVNATTRDLLADALSDFVGGGETMGELREALVPIFGEDRANRIAVTELTRAYSAGTQAAADESKAAGLEVLEIWHTDNDELVCEDCEPLNGTIRGEDWESYPPLHPNCRCSVDTELKR